MTAKQQGDIPEGLVDVQEFFKSAAEKSQRRYEDEIRENFQSSFPFPPGVKWDGDFIHGSNEVIGSFRNATEWSAMWRGFRKAWELANEDY